MNWQLDDKQTDRQTDRQRELFPSVEIQTSIGNCCYNRTGRFRRTRIIFGYLSGGPDGTFREPCLSLGRQMKHKIMNATPNFKKSKSL